MTVDGLDHIYIETAHYQESVRFWKAAGFEMTATWGEDDHAACRLSAGSTYVVVVEVAADEPTTSEVHFRLRKALDYATRVSRSRDVEIVNNLEQTHWGTRWVRLRDPDGRVFAFDEVPEPSPEE